MSEKKVIAVIVEGPSEEAALGTIFKEYFSGDEIQFVVVYGDIAADDYSSLDNIVKIISYHFREKYATSLRLRKETRI